MIELRYSWDRLKAWLCCKLGLCDFKCSDWRVRGVNIERTLVCKRCGQTKVEIACWLDEEG